MNEEGAVMQGARPVVLTVAGFDPSSGAGVTADLKVFAAHRLYGVAAITALTVQSTQGVRWMEPVEAGLLGETLACLAEDVTVAGVKIGMLGTRANVGVVAEFLRTAGVARERVVLDPVVRSSSGRDLLTSDGVEALRAELLPQVGWVTPNLAELRVLTGVVMEGREAVLEGAWRLADRVGALGNAELHVVVTGGHLEPPDDFLRTAEGEELWFAGRRVETTATHGTGCSFSSALLCRLVMGDGPAEAVTEAKRYVREAMEAAYLVGRGHGPLHHLYGLERKAGE
ncbi:MAG: bifunctional hydroxymethylpyrimidine kinase/phosphomethylpyrimidine kinase [Acidobacteriaceae bacterium]